MFDKEHPDFKLLVTCDNYFRELRADGVGAESQPTEPYFTVEDEEKLWNTAVLSTHTPEGLLNAVFFSNGKNSILHGGEEHRHLKISQLQKNISPDGKVRYTYTENSSKNRSGGFNQLDVPHKVVHQYEDPRAGPRCHVFLLDLYLSKIPNRAKDQDIFYLRPLPSVPLKESIPWFTCAPVGKNTLSQMTKKMCGEAKIDGNKTNHSLRAYATSKLFKLAYQRRSSRITLAINHWMDFVNMRVYLSNKSRKRVEFWLHVGVIRKLEIWVHVFLTHCLPPHMV